jgi:DNA end-binding protein Ku
MWKGTIGYGLAAIPVKAYTATEEHTLELHQMHATDGGRLRQKRVCEIDGEEVPLEEVARGYELPAGDVVMLTDDDLASLPAATPRLIDVRAFVPLEQIDPISFNKSYFLEPEPSGVKPYVLLAEALHQAERAAVVTVALRTRESLGVLRVRDQVLMLTTMLWPDEIRSPDFPFLHEDVDVAVRAVRAAVEAIEELSGVFVPDQYVDRYQEAMEALIEAKVEGREVVRPVAAEEDAAVVDLIDALRSSVEAALDTRAKDNASAVSRARAAARKAAEAKSEAEQAAKPRRRATTKSPR